MSEDGMKYFAHHDFMALAREFADAHSEIQNLQLDGYVEVPFPEFSRLQTECKYYEFY